jgi:acyl-CoA synthetase (AMP-forming)/AMP-acid ligase II
MVTSLLGSSSPSIHRLIRDRSEALRAKPYLIEARSPRSLSYDQLFDEVQRCQRALRSRGVRAGDRVGLLVSAPVTFSVWFLGALASGVWIAPLDPNLGDDHRDELERRADTLGLSAILSDQREPRDVSIKWIVVSDAELDAGGPSGTESVELDHSGGGVILSSSGTTGTPKVVALASAQLLATANLVARHNLLDENDRGFNPLPLWHINAEVVGILATLVAGSSLVLDDRFHRTGFWKIVGDFEVTWINAVPAIISRLASLETGEIPPARVRFVRSASAPLAPQLLATFEAAISIPIIESYGMTEAASQICANPLVGIRKAGSVGVPVGVDVRTVALEEASDALDGNVGHIEIKGPTVITSYESAAYDDRFDADGWLRTGDLGFLDDDGYLFIVGRSDDVINRGGEKIYPLEVENTLASVEGVARVAVIGEADEVFGQVPVAYIQPTDLALFDDGVGVRELVNRLRSVSHDAFTKAHRPVAFRLTRELPSHATGKVRKGLLRQGDVVVEVEERL